MTENENWPIKGPDVEKNQKLPTMAHLGLDSVVRQHKIIHKAAFERVAAF